MSNTPFGIDEVQGRPKVILERTPYRMVVIDRDGIVDPHVFHGSTNVISVFLKVEFRCVHADHRQSLDPGISPPMRGHREVRGAELIQV